jgi:hypothetical protein
VPAGGDLLRFVGWLLGQWVAMVQLREEAMWVVKDMLQTLVHVGAGTLDDLSQLFVGEVGEHFTNAFSLL